MSRTSRPSLRSHFETPSAALALLLLATYALFAPALRFGFVWDDLPLVLADPRLRSFEHLGSLLSEPLWQATPETRDTAGYYRPVVSLAYLVQYQAFGERPFGYHVVGLALHLACVALAFAWLRSRLACANDEGSAASALATTLAASAGATFFALHPSKAESVAWISGCADVLMTLFVLAGARAAKRGRAFETSAWTALALLSKEAAVVAPALFALDAVWLERDPTARRAARRSAAWATLTTASVLAVRLARVPLPPRMNQGLTHELPERVLASLGEYVSALIWPVASTSLRGHIAFEASGDLITSPLALVLGATSLVLVTATWLAARTKLVARFYAADLAWLVLPLLPVLNVFPLHLQSLVAERFTYLPSLGLAACLARACLAWQRRSSRAPRAVFAITCMIALFFVVAAAPRVRAFASDRTLWRYEHARNPRAGYPLYRLVNEAILDDDGDRAIELARQGYGHAREDHLPAYEARFVLLMAQALTRRTPSNDRETLHELRDFYEALARDEMAVLRMPTFVMRARFGSALSPIVRNDLRLFVLPRVLAHARAGDLDRALELASSAAASAPESIETWEVFASLLERTGRHEAAREALRRAATLRIAKSPSAR